MNPKFYEDVDAHEFRFYNNIRATNDQKSFDGSIKVEHNFESMKQECITVLCRIVIVQHSSKSVCIYYCADAE